MNSKISQTPGDVFKSFSHKTKINPGNVNDDELMSDITEITEKINFEKTDGRIMPFFHETIGMDKLREDKEDGMDGSWLKSANETKDSFIYIPKIFDGKDN